MHYFYRIKTATLGRRNRVTRRVLRLVVTMTLLTGFGCAHYRGVTQIPNGPDAHELSTILGVRIDHAQGEINQYLIRARQGSVDLSKLGKIHTDLGYAVGLTLPNGAQI